MKNMFKKNGRRILSAALCLLMMITALPLSAFAWSGEEGVTCTSSFGDYYVGSDGQYYHSNPNMTILINAAAVADLESEAAQAAAAVDTALVNGGVATARYISNTVTLTTSSTSEISIRIDPDILTIGVDKIRVEGPGYALTFNVSELEEDLSEILTFKAELVSATDTMLVNGNLAKRYLRASVGKMISIM